MAGATGLYTLLRMTTRRGCRSLASCRYDAARSKCSRIRRWNGSNARKGYPARDYCEKQGGAVRWPIAGGADRHGASVFPSKRRRRPACYGKCIKTNLVILGIARKRVIAVPGTRAEGPRWDADGIDPPSKEKPPFVRETHAALRRFPVRSLRSRFRPAPWVLAAQRQSSPLHSLSRRNAR